MTTLKKISLIASFFLFFFSSQIFSEPDQLQKEILDNLPPDQRAQVMERMKLIEDTQTELDEFINEPSLVQRPDRRDSDEEEDKCTSCIFGYDYFKYSPSTFAPTNSSPVSASYILGPGDKLKINIYGSKIAEYDSFISREGEILIPDLGPISIQGMTYKDAIKLIKNKVLTGMIGAEVSVSISELRSINVFLLGEAYKPGRYSMGGLTTVSNALFISGGVNEQGSLRNIQVNRDDKTIAIYDFYEFLLKGSISSDVKLQDGDVIFIPFIERRVELSGSFKRPHIYEFVEGENIQDAISLAGGFKSDVVKGDSIELSYIDQDLFERRFKDVSVQDFKEKLQDGYALNATSKFGISSETIKLSGEVKNPGEYSIRPGDTILDILKRAGGIAPDGYIEGAVFLRESVAESQKLAFMRSADDLEKTIIDIITKGALDNISEFTLSPISMLVARLREEIPPGRMVVDLDSLNLKTNPVLNFQVRDNDSLFIPKRPNSISVVGEVLYSSTMGFDPSKGVEDYLQQAGGLNDSADKDKIFIILPDGKSQLVRKSFFSSRNLLLPGSTIVVSRDPRPFDAINLTQIITPILADLATSAAAIAAISD